MVAKSLVLGWLCPSWCLPLLWATGGCGGQELLPKFGGQMAFPWLTASLAGAAGVVAVREDVPAEVRPLPNPGASLPRDRAGSGRAAWEDAGGHVPNTQTPTALPYKCICPQRLPYTSEAIFWGISPVFIVTFIARCRLGGQLAPSLPHPGGATRSHCRRGGEHWRSIRSASCPAKHLCLRGSVLGVSIRHLVMKSPFIYPNEAACFLAAR